MHPRDAIMTRRMHLSIYLAVSLLLSGCMGYKLGGSRPEGIETVAIAPVVNKTIEPAIEIQVSHALRERLQFDGRLKLVNSPESADAIMEVILTKYTLSPIAFRTERKTTPELYRLRINGTAELKDVNTGETLTTSKTYGEATFRFEADLTSAKRDALPVAAREIAKFMVDDLIERW